MNGWRFDYVKALLIVAVIAPLGAAKPSDRSLKQPGLRAINTWVETTHDDFVDGDYEHNLYATHRPGPDSAPGDVEFVARWDYNNDGFGDLTCSCVGLQYPTPTRDPSFIYLGGPSGFDPTKRLQYRIGSVGAMGGADLNLDGNTDLVAGIVYYNSTLPSVRPCGMAVFWGTDSGPNPNDVTCLGNANFHAEAFYVADLNKDGWLDLIYASYSNMNDIAILWGSSTGYSDSNRKLIPLPGGAIARHNFEVADLDKNGYLDIVVTGFHIWGSPTPRPVWVVLWGDQTGYSNQRYTSLSAYGIQAHGLSVADLNNDGWLDVVGTTYRSGDAGPGPDNSMVWFGRANRQFSAPTLLTPGNCFGGSIIADLYPRGNPDGWPDIIFLSGNISGERYPIWLYYNDGKGGFSDNNREKMEALSARDWSTSGGFISDLEPRDGYHDIFINDWATLGQASGILYGPDFGRIDELPNYVDHHGTFWEVGNTYSRKWSEDYLSSVYDAGAVVNWDGVFVEDSLPSGTGISMSVRTGNTSTPDNSWSGWYRIPYLPGPVPDSLNSRYIQYRATFTYNNPAYLPVLHEVRITYPPGIIVEPDQIRSAASPDTVVFNLWVANAGTLTDTVNMTATSTRSTWPAPGFFRTVLDPLTDTNGDGIPDVPKVEPLYPQSDSVPFVVKVYVPAGVGAGIEDTVVVWGTSALNTTVKDSAVLIVVISPQVFIRVEPDQRDSTGAGIPKFYDCWVDNEGNSEETIDLVLTKYAWPTELLEIDRITPLADHDSDGIPDIPQVSGLGRDTVHFVAKVTPPPTVLPGSRDTTLIWAYSSIDTMPAQGQGKDSVQLITLIPITVTYDTIIDTVISVEVRPDSSGFIYRPDSSALYPMWFVNHSTVDSLITRTQPGVGTDTIFRRRTNIFLPTVNLPLQFDPTTTAQGPWTLTLLDALGSPLKDLNGDGIVELTQVWPDTTRFQLSVVAPEGLGYIVGALDTTGTVSARVSAWTDFKARPGPNDVVADTSRIGTLLVPPLDVHNYPNPFPGHATTFIFSLPDDGMVTLRIFNRAGEHIRTMISSQFYTMGVHAIPWDGKNKAGTLVAPGIYLYPFYFKASGNYTGGGSDYSRGKTIVKKAVLLP